MFGKKKKEQTVGVIEMQFKENNQSKMMQVDSLTNDYANFEYVEEYNSIRGGKKQVKISATTTSDAIKPHVLPDGRPIGWGSLAIYTDNEDHAWFWDNKWTDDPVDLSNPVESIEDDANGSYTLTATGEKQLLVVGDKKYYLPKYTSKNADVIYESEATRNLTLNLAEGVECSILKDGEEATNPFEADLTETIHLQILQTGDNVAYGAIIDLHAEISPDPVEDKTFKVSADETDYGFSFPGDAEISTFADFITSEYNPVAEGDAYLEQDSGHVMLMVNETSKTYHVQDNAEDVAATDEIVDGKTYDGVEV